jgi:alpha-methylacyl-CoA racemase
MGPLHGIKIVELAGLGPGPFCGMLLSDLGADILRIDRKSGGGAPIALDPTKDILARGRRSIAVDLKSPDGIALVLDAIAAADAVFEGFRPGVVERLGLGPDVCLARNPKLVYGRMTGWGQTGPLSPRVGHDINYIALSGALSMIGPAGQKPHPPINLVGDMGGGGMLLAIGMLAALLEAKTSGKGQVVDAAMVDGASTIMSSVLSMRAMGHWSDQRGTNMGDTGAYFYNTYETADGEYVAIGSIEPDFYRALVEHAQLDPEIFGKQAGPKKWPELTEKIADVFKSRTRAEWSAIFDDIDACVTPVLSLDEAMEHPHAVARDAFVEIGGLKQPAPAPRFSRTVPPTPSAPPMPGEGGDEALAAWGIPLAKVQDARAKGAIA